MDDYLKNFKNFNNSIIYDFRLGDGGIGDYIKYLMIILRYCKNNKLKFYKKNNNLVIQNYLKLKDDIFNINEEEISKLENYDIRRPKYYYKIDDFNFNIKLNKIFYFDEYIKNNVKNIIKFLPKNYISIHLRLGDKFLETDKKYVRVKRDERSFNEENIYKLIKKSKKNVLFLCDNNEYKSKIKKKFRDIFITNCQIGHTSLENTTNIQFIDTITEFYILTNSDIIYAASRSGFSQMAAKFNDVKYVELYN